MDYSTTEYYAESLAEALSFQDIDFYSELAETNKKRARILCWYAAFLVVFSIGMMFFVRWAWLEDLISLRFIRGGWPELAFTALPFTCLGAYVWKSAAGLLRKAKDEVAVLEKTTRKKQDESERLRRLQTS